MLQIPSKLTYPVHTECKFQLTLQEKKNDRSYSQEVKKKNKLTKKQKKKKKNPENLSLYNSTHFISNKCKDK